MALFLGEGGEGVVSPQGKAAHPPQHPWVTAGSRGSRGAGEQGPKGGGGQQGQHELMLRALPAPLQGLDRARKALFYCTC